MNVQLAWNGNVTVVTGYNLRYGPSMTQFLNLVELGKVLTHSLEVGPGVWYFVVTAAVGTTESMPSNVLSVVVPAVPPPPPPPPTTTGQGFNFRGTLAFVTDGANEKCIVGAVTNPGWKTVVQVRDRVQAVDRRLAGHNFVNKDAGTAPPADFDYPCAPGDYEIWLALGDMSYAHPVKATLLDGATVLATFSSPMVLAAAFMDALGNVLTAVNWPAQNKPLLVKIQSGKLTLRIAGDTTVAHLAVTPVSVVPPPPPSGVAIAVATPANRWLVVTRREDNTSATLNLTVNKDDSVTYNGAKL